MGETTKEKKYINYTKLQALIKETACGSGVDISRIEREVLEFFPIGKGRIKEAIEALTIKKGSKKTRDI